EKLAAGGSWGIAFLVSAGIVAEIVAKPCGSPQTTELNADTRAPHPMKGGLIGMREAAGLVIAAPYLARSTRIPILLGGAAEPATTYAEYLHGRQAGRQSAMPGREVRYG